MEKSDRFPRAMLPRLAATRVDNTTNHTDSMSAILIPLYSSIFCNQVRLLKWSFRQILRVKFKRNQDQSWQEKSLSLS